MKTRRRARFCGPERRSFTEACQIAPVPNTTPSVGNAYLQLLVLGLDHAGLDDKQHWYGVSSWTHRRSREPDWPRRCSALLPWRRCDAMTIEPGGDQDPTSPAGAGDWRSPRRARPSSCRAPHRPNQSCETGSRLQARRRRAPPRITPRVGRRGFYQCCLRVSRGVPRQLHCSRYL